MNFLRILRLHESGIYEHEVKKTLKPKGFGPDMTDVPNNQLEFEAINLIQLKGVFIFLFIGLAIAFIVLQIELIVYHYY